MAKGPTEGQNRGVKLRDENGDGYGVRHTDNQPHVLIGGNTSEGTAIAVSNSVLTNSVDGLTTALKTVDYIHHEIHGGSFFEYTNAQELTNAQTISFVIVTPDTVRQPHFGFEIEGESEIDLQMFEGATEITNGTLVSNPAVINANRGESDTHTTLIYHTPTLGGGSKGTLIRRWHSGSGNKVGGMAGTVNENPLKRNTKYWFDIKNETASNNWVSWVVGWYEHDTE